MSKLDSFFNKGLKAAKCKTLLKLTIPRIKLLRNRREIQIKQMRREIAKLLENGEDATARIRVEHIVREENMMAAQEILELFCEFIAVRLPIIEAQRECPLELKEAISTVCFAAPRCADLPELLQVRILFASKYGKEFVSAATELMPDCGVNRQLIELLSVRAPSPETKLKLLKEIAEEHELDWDPAASETELSKAHEDLLNGATEFIGGAKLPLPKEKTLKYEKHDEVLNSAANQVPKVSLRHNTNTASTPEADPHVIASLHPDISHESSNQSVTSKNTAQEPHLKREQVTEEKLVDTRKDEIPVAVVGEKKEKQFLPFVSPPSASPASFSTKPITPLPSILRPESEAKVVDLQDVLAAAETAECAAAAAARSAATIAQARISELTKKTGGKFPESSNENPFHAKTPDQSAVNEKPHFGHQQSCIESAATGKLHFDHQQSFCDRNTVSDFHDLYRANVDRQPAESHDIHSFNKLKVDHDSPRHDRFLEPGSTRMQPLRLPSLDCDSYLAYPNLFSAQNSNHGSGSQSGKHGSPPGHGY